MNKRFKKVLIAAIATSAVFGGGSLTSHADAMPESTDTVKDSIDNDISGIDEIKEETTETVEEKVQPTSIEEKAEEKAQPVNNEVDKEEVVENQSNNKAEEKTQSVTSEERAQSASSEEKAEEKSQPANDKVDNEKAEDKPLIEDKSAKVENDSANKDENSLELGDERTATAVRAGQPIQNDASQNIVNGLKLINVDFIDANDPNKVITDLSNNYRVKMDFDVVGNIKEGDSLVFNMIMPEMADSSWKDEAVHDYKPFYARHNSTPVDVTASIDGKNISIGSLRNNTMTFNKNAELLNINSKLQLAFGIVSNSGSVYAIRSTSSTAKDYTLNFNTMLNGNMLRVPFRKTIKALPQRDYSWDGYGIGYTLGSYGQGKGLFDACGVSLNASIGIAKEEGTGKNSVIKIKYELPEGLEFDDTPTVRTLGLFKSRGDWVFKDSNELSTIFADYSYANNSIKKIDNSTVEQTITFNKDLPDYKGYTWEANTSSLPNVVVKDKNILKKGHDGIYPLAKAIKATIFVNGKPTNTVTMEEATITNIDSFGLGIGADTPDEPETPKPDEVTKKTENINFNTEYVKADPSLKLGYNEKKTIKEGKLGKKEIVTTTSYKTGKPVTTTKENIITSAENKVVAVGNQSVETKEVPYNTIKKEDSSLAKGETKVATKGVNGTETITKVYEVDKSTGKLINPKEDKKITKEKIDEVILVGTKVSEEIPYKTEYRANKHKGTTYKNVIQKGEKGIRENGKVIKEPKKEIIEIGTFAKIEQTGLISNWATIDVEKDTSGKIGVFNNPRKYKESNSTRTTRFYKKLDTKTGKFIEGEYDTESSTEHTPGVDGLRTLNYKGTISNWTESYTSKYTDKKQMSFDPRILDKIQNNPNFAKAYDLTTDKYIYKKANATYRANANLKYNEKKEITKAKDSMAHEKINFLTETYKEVIDNEAVDGIIEIGNKEIVVEDVPAIKGGSKPGKKTTTTIYDIDPKTGKLINPKTTTKIVHPWEEIKDIATKTSKSKEDIKYDTVYVGDASLEYSKQKVFQNGSNGQKEITVISKVVNGKRVEEKSEHVIKKPTSKIISVGNREVINKDIPYKTIKKETKDLEIGQSKVQTKGTAGVETTTKVYEVDKNTGKLVNPKEDKKITKNAIDEVILVGSKKVIPAKNIEDNAKKVTHKDISFNTIYKKDESLKYEEKKIIQKGVKGDKEITQIGSNKPSEKVVKKPIDEIITIGNKKVVIEDVPSVKGGNKPGKKTTTTVWDIDPKTGKLINPKSTVKTVYSWGKIEDIATKVTKVYDKINAKIVYEADETLPYNTKKVIKKNVDGERETTIISKVVDGKRNESRSTKITKNPIDGLIKIGNKKIEEKDLDPLKDGGKSGKKITTTIWDIDPKTGKLINPKTTVKNVYSWDKIEDIAKTTKITKEDVPFETIYKADENLPYKDEKVLQKGVNGENKITTVSQKGKDDIVTKTLIKKPIGEIKAIGNKQVVTEDIPSTNGGKQGKKITTTIWDIDPKTGKLINPKISTKTVYNWDKIEDIATKTTKSKGEIPFKTVYVGDASLEYGKTKVFQKGTNGIKEITTISKVVDGKRVEETNEKVLEKPTTNIISVGNIRKITEEIPYKTINEKSKDLAVGKSEIKSKGQVGEKEISIISEVDPKTGKLINEKREEVITKEPIGEIKLIGAKKVIPWAEIKDITTTKPKEEVKEIKEEQPVRQAMAPTAQANVQTGIESANPAVITALLSSVGLAITNKKKKED